ncbi:aminoglycoside phosphotransferase family protein [Ornithinimicrobium sp. Y1694]|uniref:aminoglycoside phosphotransferase family protein n=1 Tax=Ornithinimicrobium sp. Y1694 TaxID=3418590 RepID=UPI003CF1DA5B
MRGPTGQEWLDELPALIEHALDRWELRPDGEARHGECALVLPVVGRSPRGPVRAAQAALKLTWPHAEARHEHLALRAWGGRGAVELLAADPARWTLLLERLDAERELSGIPILEACEEIGGLMLLLDRPALPQCDLVADKAVRWADQLARGTPLVPRRLTEQAAGTLADLLASAPEPRLVHEDLHDLNVLAPLADQGEPREGRRAGAWVAIDPKPVSGEWAYAVAPIVWNRADETSRASSLRTHARLRADLVAEAAGLDPDRVQAWTLVRLVLNAVWAADYAPFSDEFRGRMIALAKAFTDAG